MNRNSRTEMLGENRFVAALFFRATIFAVCFAVFSSSTIAREPAPSGWVRTFGGPGEDHAAAVAIGPDGSVFVAGSITEMEDAGGDTVCFISKYRADGDLAWSAEELGGCEKIAVGSDGSVAVLGWRSLTKLQPSGERAWSKFIGAPGRGLAMGGDGSLVVTGGFKGRVDLDPGEETDIRVSLRRGKQDVFVTKLGSDGKYLWSITFGGEGEDRGNDVVVAKDGTISLLGGFTETMDFDPGEGTEQRTSNGGSDIFLPRFDAKGRLLWARTFGGATFYNEGGTRLVHTPDGGVAIGGVFGDRVDFDPGPGRAWAVAQGWYDLFVSQFDAAGTHQWTRTFGGSWNGLAHGLAVDDRGRIFIAGYLRGMMDFAPGDERDVHGSPVHATLFVTVLTAQGEHAWTRSLERTGDAPPWIPPAVDSQGREPVDIAVRGNWLVLSGRFQGRQNFAVPPSVKWTASKGGEDGFLLRLPVRMTPQEILLHAQRERMRERALKWRRGGSVLSQQGSICFSTDSLPPAGADSYWPRFAVDGRVDTAWVANVEDSSEGEGVDAGDGSSPEGEAPARVFPTLTVQLPQEIEIQSVRILPGVGLGEEPSTFAMPRKVRVVVGKFVGDLDRCRSSVDLCETVVQKMEPLTRVEAILTNQVVFQTIPLPPISIACQGEEPCSLWLRIEVASTYPGSKNPNPGISEIEVVRRPR